MGIENENENNREKRELYASLVRLCKKPSHAHQYTHNHALHQSKSVSMIAQNTCGRVVNCYCIARNRNCTHECGGYIK